MRKKWILTVGVGGLFLALGWLLGDYWVQIANEALIMVLFAVSFSLLYGYTGLLSFGQGAYFAMGAYGFALALTGLNWPFPLCLLLGIVAGGLWALITGFVCVRLSGIYFGIMTVVIAQATFYIIFQWYGLTGGDDGIQGLRPPGFLAHPRGYYYYTLAIVAATFWGYFRLVNSPFGLSLKCIRENMLRATFVGLDVRKQRLKVFVAAGVISAIAGVLYAPFTRSVVPQMADWLTSGKAVFMGVLGGVYHILGPLVGAVVWVFLDAFVSGFTEYWPLIIGLIIFLIVFFMPGGLMGLLTALSGPKGEQGDG
jgi:branched-chain amino acid transport system permease protein